MHVFYGRYYRINTVCLKRIGLWPHDDALKNKVKRYTVMVLIVSIIIPQAIRLFEEWNRDIDIVIEVIGSLMYFIVPINIILSIYITVPLTPVFLDMIDPLNYTRMRMFPYFAEYFIDDQKYYFELTVHCWIVCILSVQIYGTFDTSYAQCVQHVRALFAIVEYRLDKTMKLQIKTKNSHDKKLNDDEVLAEMKEAILLHKQAIQFVNLIEQSYTHVYFWVLVLNTSLLSLTAVDTMLNLEKGNYKQMIRIGTLYIGFSCHLLFNMIPGQKVIDSSTQVQTAAFHCEWFNHSARIKKLLNIMILRSAIPCTFTAKGICVLDLETFSFVFKKSISYVTMIGSMR